MKPATLAGKKIIPVEELEKARVYVAVPEYLHGEIADILRSHGHTDFICVDGELEYKLMQSLYKAGGRLDFWEGDTAGDSPSLPGAEELSVYVAKSLHDKPLQGQVHFPAGSKTVQAGTALGRQMGTDFHECPPPWGRETAQAVVGGWNKSRKGRNDSLVYTAIFAGGVGRRMEINSSPWPSNFNLIMHKS